MIDFVYTHLYGGLFVRCGKVCTSFEFCQLSWTVNSSRANMFVDEKNLHNMHNNVIMNL